MRDIEISRLRREVENVTLEVDTLKRLVRRMIELNGIRWLTTEDLDFLRAAGD